MSDLIRYIAGNTAGRDHLGWPTVLPSELVDYGLDPAAEEVIWPIGVTLDQAMAWAWRVKKWKLTGTCEVQETAGIFNASGSAAIDSDLEMRNNGGLPATREQDIVSIDVTPFHALGNFGTVATAGTDCSTWEIVGALTQNGVRKVGDFSAPANSETGLSTPINSFVLFDNDQFFPSFGGPGTLIGGAVTDILFALATSHRNPVTLLSGAGGAPLLKAPGVMTVIPHVASSFDVPMQLAWRFTGQDAGDAFSGTGDLVLQLEAVEFWPYANSQSLPVYDTENGSTLRSPFS